MQGSRFGVHTDHLWSDHSACRFYSPYHFGGKDTKHAKFSCMIRSPRLKATIPDSLVVITFTNGFAGLGVGTLKRTTTAKDLLL